MKLSRIDLLKVGFAGLFILIIMLVVSQRFELSGGGSLVVIAAMIGGYMAINIGANDCRNI